jgi:hypothetical protein
VARQGGAGKHIFILSPKGKEQSPGGPAREARVYGHCASSRWGLSPHGVTPPRSCGREPTVASLDEGTHRCLEHRLTRLHARVQCTMPLCDINCAHSLPSALESMGPRGTGQGPPPDPPPDTPSGPQGTRKMIDCSFYERSDGRRRRHTPHAPAPKSSLLLRNCLGAACRTLHCSSMRS